MREELQILQLSILLTQLQVGLMNPDTYHGEPNDMYQSLLAVADPLEIDVPSWEQFVRSPDESIKNVRSDVQAKYPDLDDYLVLGKMGSGLIITGFGDINDNLRAVLKTMEQPIVDILSKHSIPKKQIEKWFEMCRKSKNRVLVAEEFINLVKSIGKDNDVRTQINISGVNVEGQLNVAGKDISSPVMNITLSELEKRIDESNENSKHEAKSILASLLKHPLVVKILGSVAGA